MNIGLAFIGWTQTHLQMNANVSADVSAGCRSRHLICVISALQTVTGLWLYIWHYSFNLIMPYLLLTQMWTQSASSHMTSFSVK